MIELRGITWDHTRGYLPLVATAQRYSELYPEIAIVWQKRSLQQFADQSLAGLAERFDLLVIDHPSIGMAAENSLLIPLDEHLSAAFLDEQATASVGESHPSYAFRGHQWALAIDAATPVSGWRPDLLTQAGAAVPRTWAEMIELARRGLVAFPGIPIDSLMHFFMMCTGLGEMPFSQPGVVIPEDIGVQALEMLRSLAVLVSPECAHRNPIRTWEHLVASDAVCYCPFAYGYSNYARAEYAKHPLEMGGLIEIDDRHQCCSTLGGAGLAVSSRSLHISEAVEYSSFVASPECQRGLYFTSGGQPGHRSAWLDPETNRVSRNFFRKTLPTLDEAWLRPRWSGYLDFQERAGAIVHRYLWSGGNAGDKIRNLNRLATETMMKRGSGEGNETA
jgi:multiple sugar transport system substrate-binding protein